MANTTYFGWETPDDTDLVKDGAAAIRTLGQAIDTSLQDLEGGTTNQVLAKNSDADMDFKWVADATGIPATIFDAKGDLIVASAADTAARLAVGGTNGHVLTVNSGATNGIQWAAVSSGLTLIDEVSFSASNSVNVNDVFSSTYKNYKIFIVGASTTASPSQATMRLRVSSTDTTSNYYTQEIYALSTTLATRADLFGSDEIYIGAMGSSTQLESLYSIDINSPFLTTPTGLFSLNNSVPEIHLIGGGQKDSTSFTGFTLLNSQTATGIIYVYGYAKE
jgi:hypothetical protein